MQLHTPQLTTCPALEDNWVLTADFHYVGLLGYLDITIPRGFVTDLASIPRFLWRVIAPFELSLTAPILHDYFYRQSGISQGYNFGREQVDNIFLRVMEQEGVSWWRRTLAYRGVRMFGGSSWGAAKLQVIALEGD